MTQTRQMMFNPATGATLQGPCLADHYRDSHGEIAWLFNPWTGRRRNPYDIGSDVFGLLIDDSNGVWLSASEDTRPERRVKNERKILGKRYW